MSHVFGKMAAHDKISPSLLERIYKNAKSTKDTSTLLTVASRTDLPVRMHKSLLALQNPAITGARLKYMNSADLHALVSVTVNKKVCIQAAQCTNLLDSTVTLLLDNGNPLIWEKLLVNSSISEDLRKNALARYIQSSLTLKGKSLKSAAQLILSFPEYVNTMFTTLSGVDPLYTGRLAVLLLEYLPWDSKVGNRAIVYLISTFSRSLTGLSVAMVDGSAHTNEPSIAPRDLTALSKQYGWSLERQHNSADAVIYVRHALSNISKLLRMDVLRTSARQEVTNSLDESLAFLKDYDNKVPLTSQERTHTLGRLADILVSLRAHSHKPKGALAISAQAAKSCTELDTLIDRVSEYTNSLDLVAVLASPHYRYSSSMASVLATSGVGDTSQCWVNVKKAMEYRSPVSSEVLATLCVTSQALTPVSVAYIDNLLSFHSDPVATLGATLKLLKNGTLPATVGLVGSRYFEPMFTHDVPLAELPSKIPANVLKVLVDTVEDPDTLSIEWDVLTLTTNFPKVSLKEALESGKLLG